MNCTIDLLRLEDHSPFVWWRLQAVGLLHEMHDWIVSVASLDAHEHFQADDQQDVSHAGLNVYAAMIDSELDRRGFIVPGLGDAGDRAFGTH